MRVLESERTPSYSMGKNRKHKLRKAKEASDSSDDGTIDIPVCNHISMAVNLASMRKGLSKQVFGTCSSCTKDGSATGRRPERLDEASTDQQTGTQQPDDNGQNDYTLWVCLQCGHQGCDRSSREKHGLKHYETPRSSCHCLVINTSTWTCWCYKCDDEVPGDRSKRLQECLELLRKQAGLPQPDTSKRLSTGASAAVGGSDIASRDTNSRPLTPKSSIPGLCQKIKGLNNLGNTCFFNAVLQNLAQTQSLEWSIMERAKKGRSMTLTSKHLSDTDESGSGDDSDTNDPTADADNTNQDITVTFGEPGVLTTALTTFLREMNNNVASRSSTVNPNALFTQVCKKNQRFRGFQQQDSHELLRYLLDNMKTEEIKRGQASILKYFKLPENIQPKKVDESTRIKVREYGRQAKHTFVDAVFGGQMISTVVCEECKFISQIFEPFLDLSLPVTEEKPQRPNQLPTSRRKDSQEVDSPEESSPATGLEGFAGKPEKQSKLERKQKRQAKKDAKRKAKLSKNKTLPAGAQSVEDEEALEDTADKQLEVTEKETLEEDGHSSNKDDPSDADVEDNLESDTSKIHKYSFADDSFIKDSSGTQDNHHIIGGSISDSACVGHTSNVNTPEEQSCSSEFCRYGNEREATSPIEAGSDQMATTCNYTTANVGVGIHSHSNGIPNGCLCYKDCSTNDETKDISKFKNHICSQDCLAGINGPSGLKCDMTQEMTTQTLEQVGNIINDNYSIEKLDNSLSDSHTIEQHSNSLSDVLTIESLSNSHHSNSNITNGNLPASPVTTPNIGKDTNLMSDSFAFKNSHEELLQKMEQVSLDNGQADNFNHTSKAVELGTSQMLKSKSADSVGSTENGGRISPKSTKNSMNPRQLSSKHSKNRKELKEEAKFKSTITLGHRYQPSSRECSILSCLHQFTSAELLTGNNKFGCANCTKLKNKQLLAKDKKETVKSNASKQFLVYSPPAILTLHMKRFEQVGFSSRKVNRHVDFPFVLDLAPYCSSLCQGIKHGQKRVLYALYGVVEHSGRLNTGHYTAYVKVRPNIGLSNSFLTNGFPSCKDYIQRYMENLANGVSEDVEESDEVMEEKLVPPGRWYHISDSRVVEVTDSAVQKAQAYLLFYERIY